MQSILYYQAPPWVFAVCYTAFGALVVLTWTWVKPRGFHRNKFDNEAKTGTGG